MKKPSCPEFDEWLERLPRRDLSPSFRRHLEHCETCRRNYNSLKVTVDFLHEEKSPAPLSPELTARMTKVVNRTSVQRTKSRLTRKILTAAAVSFPVIAAVNVLWAVLGYRLLVRLSSALALTYLILFAAAASLTAALVFGSLPLVAGWCFKGLKEKTS